MGYLKPLHRQDSPAWVAVLTLVGDPVTDYSDMIAKKVRQPIKNGSHTEYRWR